MASSVDVAKDRTVSSPAVSVYSGTSDKRPSDIGITSPKRTWAYIWRFHYHKVW